MFNWSAAVRETKKAGKRMPTDEEFDRFEEKESFEKVIYVGYRSTNTNFYYLGKYGYFWSASVSGSSAWIRCLFSDDTPIYRIFDNQTYGFSVRCLKN